MMRFAIFGLLLCLVACKGPEPRKPVKVKSGSYFTETVERNKKLLAQEEALIQEIIKADTAHAYMSSSSGFWYHYEIAQDSTRTLPQPDDEVILVYNIMTFTNDTIYTHDDIGVVQMLVDKEQLFPGMRGAVKLLREGERATFLFPSSQAYGYHGDTNKIPPMTPLKSSVEIIKINKKPDSLNLKSNL